MNLHELLDILDPGLTINVVLGKSFVRGTRDYLYENLTDEQLYLSVYRVTALDENSVLIIIR